MKEAPWHLQSSAEGARAFFSQQDFRAEDRSIQGSACSPTMPAPRVSQQPSGGDAAFSNLCKTFLLLPPPWCGRRESSSTVSVPSYQRNSCWYLSSRDHPSEIPYRKRAVIQRRWTAFLRLGVPLLGMTLAQCLWPKRAPAGLSGMCSPHTWVIKLPTKANTNV